MKKKNSEYSKALLRQESALIWVISVSFIILAFYCIRLGFVGTLPWLSAMVAFPWTAYGVSQAMYYKKSEKENTKGGIKYDTVLLEAQAAFANAAQTAQQVTAEAQMEAETQQYTQSYVMEYEYPTETDESDPYATYSGDESTI